jgi:glycosyltransferase involved in cell wall biosynthesis
MNVLVDGFVFENTHQKGIRRYMDELLRRVECPFSLFLENPAAGSIPKDWGIVGPLGPSPLSRMDLLGRWNYRERAKKWRKEIQSHSVFHTSFFRHCPIPGIPSVFVVHDMVCEFMPYHYWGNAGQEAVNKMAAFESAAAIIAVSDATRIDLLRLYPHFAHKVQTIHHGADHFHFATECDLDESRKHIKAPYALFVGDRVGYKNFHGLLMAMLESGWPGDLRLKVAGQSFSKAEYLNLKNLGLQNKVEVFGPVSHAELADLYRGAEAFVFPSFFEGFGFPLLEAQANGAPVVATDMPVFHEVGGAGFIPCDSKDPASIANCVSQARAFGFRNRLRDLGFENVKRFTWAETARKTQAIWRKCLGY